MFGRLFHDRNVYYILSASMLVALIAFLYYFNNATTKYSYLVFNSSDGQIQRLVVNNYSYVYSLIGITFSIGAFLIFLLLTLYSLGIKIKPETIKDEISTIEEQVGSENSVYYGKGAITKDLVKDFVYKYPESAVKFAFEKNLDGTELDPLIKRLHREWRNRGMYHDMVIKEIADLLNVPKLPERNLYELTLSIRNKIGNQAKKPIETAVVKPAPDASATEDGEPIAEA